MLHGKFFSVRELVVKREELVGERLQAKPEFFFTSKPFPSGSELLREFFEGVALDNVAWFVVVEVAQFDAAFES
jgi:hypothetical protein